jgi:hypothetical protein
MMRNFLLAGTAAVVVGLAASSAFAFPANSPYAIWEPQAVDQGIAPSRAIAAMTPAFRAIASSSSPD